MILYCDSREHTIEDEKGRRVHIDNAKVFWNDGKVEDCNLSFERLANLGWNWDKLDSFYNENPLQK